jgi:hypothetical protein
VTLAACPLYLFLAVQTPFNSHNNATPPDAQKGKYPGITYPFSIFILPSDSPTSIQVSRMDTLMKSAQS